ncbi:MAG: hypothetical protein QOI99_2070, partial [Actinomycetota bacterium]|nr:hypothetical protein [Actinomycetota bacterium]
MKVAFSAPGRLRLVAAAALGVGLAVLLGGPASAATTTTPLPPPVTAALDCSQGNIGKAESIDQLHEVRASIDRSL